MPFHMFGPPPHLHLPFLPIILSCALTIAAGSYVIARYGVPAGIAKLGSKLRDHVDSWHARSGETSPSKFYSRAHARASAATGNAAFDTYRAETLKTLEKEGAEFRAYLNGLRHAKDRSAFEAFLNERRARDSGNTPR